jgi:hypothetical protein
MNLVETAHARDLLRDFKQDGHEVYNSPQANLGTTLAVLGQLEDTPVVRCLQANLRVAIAQVKERSLGYKKLAAGSYSRSRLEHPLQRRRSNAPLESVAEEGQGENKEVQSVNPAAHAAANAVANSPANAAANTVGNTDIMQLMLPVHNQMSPPTQDKMPEPNLRRHKLTTLKVVNVCYQVVLITTLRSSQGR